MTGIAGRWLHCNVGHRLCRIRVVELLMLTCWDGGAVDVDMLGWWVSIIIQVAMALTIDAILGWWTIVICMMVL